MEISINLLPKNKKDDIERTKRFKSILGWEFIILLILALFFAFLFGINYLIKVNMQISTNADSNDLSGDQYTVIKKYESKFLDINNQLAAIAKVDKDQLYWSELFLRLNRATPDHIEITTLSTKDYAVFLVGKAATREDLLAYKEKLVGEGCFSNVILPLSNLVSKENIDFQLDFKVDKDCLKMK